MKIERKIYLMMFNRSLKVAEYAKELNVTRQAVDLSLRAIKKEIRSSENYIEIQDLISKRKVIEIKSLPDGDGKELCMYEEYGRVYDNWMLPIDCNAFNIQAKEIFAVVPHLTEEKFLESIEITAPEEFIKVFAAKIKNERSHVNQVKKLLSKYTVPVRKEKIIKEFVLNGNTKKMFDSTVNRADAILNLGKTICLKNTFLKTYLNKELITSIVNESIRIVKEHDLVKTDTRWLSTEIKELVPGVKELSAYEVKAILTNTEYFKSDKKFNIVYNGQSRKEIYETISELITSIFKENNLVYPVRANRVNKMIASKGRTYTYTSLLSTGIPNAKEISKIDEGYILTKNIDSYKKKKIEIKRAMRDKKVLDYVSENLDGKYNILTISNSLEAKEDQIEKTIRSNRYQNILYLVSELNYFMLDNDIK